MGDPRLLPMESLEFYWAHESTTTDGNLGVDAPLTNECHHLPQECQG